MPVHENSITDSDSISRAYLRLAFHIERLVPGFIDAYFGPPEWKAEAEAEGNLPPADLHRDAEALLHDIAAIADELRREWLAKQVTAITCSITTMDTACSGAMCKWEIASSGSVCCLSSLSRRPGLERVPFECTGWIRGFSRNRLKARIQLTVYAIGNRYKSELSD